MNLGLGRCLDFSLVEESVDEDELVLFNENKPIMF